MAKFQFVWHDPSIGKTQKESIYVYSQLERHAI